MARFSVFRLLFTQSILISPGYPGEKTTWVIWRIYDWSIGKLTNTKEMRNIPDSSKTMTSGGELKYTRYLYRSGPWGIF
jgi:hypothetical protein